MRGEPSKQASMLFLKSPESLVPQEHPIRAVKALVEVALREMSGKFDEMYAAGGRASIPPEWLLKSSLLMALYSVRSERMFCEQLRYNMLFRWFLGMDMTEAPFDHSTFSKNRERLMKHEVSQEFFRQVVGQARDAHLMSADHFTVDGTLIDAWASLKSFKAKEESGAVVAVQRASSDLKLNPHLQAFSSLVCTFQAQTAQTARLSSAPYLASPPPMWPTPFRSLAPASCVTSSKGASSPSSGVRTRA
jgi:transposase